MTAETGALGKKIIEKEMVERLFVTKSLKFACRRMYI
jgi:hypothetical protein